MVDSADRKLIALSATATFSVWTAIAVVLFTASALKGHHSIVASRDGFADAGQLLIAEYEMILGTLVLAGVFRSWVWAAVVVSFAAFACVSLASATAGEQSCGCLGSVIINPWWMFALDVGTVLSAVATRTFFIGPLLSKSSTRNLMTIGTLCAAIPCIAVGLYRGPGGTRSATAHTESRARDSLPGLLVRTREADVGVLGDGTIGQATFEFTNHGSLPITIDGVVSHCGCTAAKPDKTVIAPGEFSTIPVTVNSQALIGHRNISPLPFRKTIDVNVSDSAGNAALVELGISGQLPANSELVAIPSALDIGTLTAGSKTTRYIDFRGIESVVAQLPDQIDISLDEPTHVAIRVEAAGKRVAHKPVRFVCNAVAGRIGHVDTSVIVRVEGRVNHRLQIPIRGELVNQVVSQPSRLFLAAATGRQKGGGHLAPSLAKFKSITA